MSFFKTPAGTQLPFLNLKGKEYLQISHRLVWFREVHADWTIQTSIVSTDKTQSTVRAEILTVDGRVVATGYKQQLQQGFSAHLEKAETGSIGRALAFLGFGTAHAQELEEDETTPLGQLADSPVSKNTKTAADYNNEAQKAFGGAYVVSFGKFKGQELRDIDLSELKSYSEFLKRKAHEEVKPIRGQVEEFINQVNALGANEIGKLPF